MVGGSEEMNYVTQITGWTITLDTTYFYSIETTIRTNKPVTPEIIGHLIGMAKPTFENVKCSFCKKDILEDEKTTKESGDDFMFRVKMASTHQKCYDKEHEKWLKEPRMTYE